MSRKIERVEIHDLSDALLQQGQGLPRRKARRRALHLDCVRWATANEAGRNIHTPLRCPLRPKTKACPGRLIVRRQDLPAQVRYVCEVCGGGATLIGWSKGEADLRFALSAQQAHPLSILLDIGQHEVLARILVESEFLQPRLYQARPRSCAWELRLDLEEAARLYMYVFNDTWVKEPSDRLIRGRILDRLSKALCERVPVLDEKAKSAAPSLFSDVAYWVYVNYIAAHQPNTRHASPPEDELEDYEIYEEVFGDDFDEL